MTHQPTPPSVDQAPQHTLPRRLTIAEQFRRSPATFGLIALTALIFIAQTASISLFGTDWLIQWGAKSRSAILAGQVWRFITPIFLHLGLAHIAINMYSLYAIGPSVERFFGSQRMLVVYLLSGIGGVVLSLALSPYPSAGASGAIFGLVGALAAFLYAHRTLFGRIGRLQLRQILFVVLINLAFGLTPGIDNWGHVGGLLSGAALAWAIGPNFQVLWVSETQRSARDARPWPEARSRVLLAAGILAALAAAAMLSPIGG